MRRRGTGKSCTPKRRTRVMNGSSARRRVTPEAPAASHSCATVVRHRRLPRASSASAPARLATAHCAQFVLMLCAAKKIQAHYRQHRAARALVAEVGRSMTAAASARARHRLAWGTFCPPRPWPRPRPESRAWQRPSTGRTVLSAPAGLQAAKRERECVRCASLWRTLPARVLELIRECAVRARPHPYARAGTHARASFPRAPGLRRFRRARPELRWAAASATPPVRLHAPSPSTAVRLPHAGMPCHAPRPLRTFARRLQRRAAEKAPAWLVAAAEGGGTELAAALAPAR